MQIFEVAFSRRMCCSRVARVSTNPRLPLRSTVCPTRRPGICRTKASRVAITPQYGPPKVSGTPNDWASMAMMSAERGGSTTPSEIASEMETTSIAPLRCAISARASISSIVPKKFGDCTKRQAVSAVMAFSTSLGSRHPDSPNGNVASGIPW